MASNEDSTLTTLIIAGSPRAGSQSSRIAAVISEALQQLRVASNVFDLGRHTIANWQDSANESEKKSLETLRSQACAADALVLISPEWAGMVPPALKNALLHLTNGEIAHKPVLIIGVSAGRGGAYPISELRSFAFKNSHLVFLPHHLIFRGVSSLFSNGYTSSDEASQEMRMRLQSALQELKLYAQAITPIRAQLNKLRENFPYGM